MGSPEQENGEEYPLPFCADLEVGEGKGKGKERDFQGSTSKNIRGLATSAASTVKRISNDILASPNAKYVVHPVAHAASTIKRISVKGVLNPVVSTASTIKRVTTDVLEPLIPSAPTIRNIPTDIVTTVTTTAFIVKHASSDILNAEKMPNPKDVYNSVSSTATTFYHTKLTRRRVKKLGPFFVLGLVALLFCQWYTPFLPFELTALHRKIFNLGFEMQIPVPVELQRKWGPYTPWYSVQPYPPPPDHCRITQVNILQRHDARYPTNGAAEGMKEALEKIQLAPEYKNASLSFLKEYKFTLETDLLVPFGAAHAKYTGAQTFKRYKGLVEDDVPFVRASGKQRVVDSATNWAAGFADASKNMSIPKLNVIIDEQTNNTLHNSQCPAAGTSDAQTDAWISAFATPIAERLNTYAPGANLTAADVYSLMLFCPFESIATLSKSPFCSPSLFSSAEFSQFSYTFDLDKFYLTGYGQPLGRVQGVGYVNELLARLMEKPVRDNTQTNHTLDENIGTFPLDRNVYIDFTHDNQMIAVYGALGLFKQRHNLDPGYPSKKRTWYANELVPFGSKMVTERLSCQRKGKKKEKQYVRILVNDALQPLDFCGDADGMCELKKLVKSQEYARRDGEGDWEKCFEDGGDDA